MLLVKINEEIKDAMRNKEDVKRDCLRAVVSDVRLKEKELKRELSEDEVLEVITKHIKTVKESIEAYTKGGRQDLVGIENVRLESLGVFLPQQITKEDVTELVRVTIRDMQLDTSNIGLLMRELMPIFKGKADSKMVSSVIKSFVTK